MKNKLLRGLLVGALLVGSLAGCGSTAATSGTASNKVIKVAASATPHAEILEQAKEALKAKGWDLQVTVFNDYVQPNEVVESGEFDANYMQHLPYLDSFNKEKGTHIVSVGGIHYEPFGIYPGTKKNLADLADGDTIAVPNDTTNEARALLLLQDNGIIKLKEGVGLQATKLDIEENPLNLEIIESEAAQVARAVQDVDIACVNGNYALGAGLSDPIAVESVESEAAQTYANIVCVKEGNEDSPKTKALVKALTSDTAKKFIESKYGNSVIPVF